MTEGHRHTQYTLRKWKFCQDSSVDLHMNMLAYYTREIEENGLLRAYKGFLVKNEFINAPNYWKPLRDILAICSVFDLFFFSFFFFLHGSRTILLKKKEERQSGIVTLYNLLWLNACDTVFIWYSSLEMPLLCYMSYSFFISSHRKLKGRFAKDAIFSSVTLTLFDITTELD